MEPKGANVKKNVKAIITKKGGSTFAQNLT